MSAAGDAARRERLDALILDAHSILDRAIAEHFHAASGVNARRLAGVVLLFSGGNDSTVLAHLMRDRATHFAHANTTIGIERTREFVRDTAATWNVPLLERRPPRGSAYVDLITERRKSGEVEGFPGPAKHWKMYQRLKLRAMEQVQRELITNPYRERLIFLAGRRLTESARRTQRSIPEIERRKSVVWVSPLRNWTTSDMNTYRMVYPGCPRNEVSDLIHMSGECLCGAFAGRGEIEEIGDWFPHVADEIKNLERIVTTAGAPDERCRWGWGAYRSEEPSKVGPMCSSCEFRAPGLVTP